jgi:hypothetical protein
MHEARRQRALSRFAVAAISALDSMCAATIATAHVDRSEVSKWSRWRTLTARIKVRFEGSNRQMTTQSK